MLAKGKADLADVLSSAGNQYSDAKKLAQKIKSGAAILWVKTDDETSRHALDLMQRGKAESIIII